MLNKLKAVESRYEELCARRSSRIFIWTPKRPRHN